MLQRELARQLEEEKNRIKRMRSGNLLIIIIKLLIEFENSLKETWCENGRS